MITTRGIMPTIQSYESLVQAWILTGIQEGIQHADAILDDSLLQHYSSRRRMIIIMIQRALFLIIDHDYKRLIHSLLTIPEIVKQWIQKLDTFVAASASANDTFVNNLK